jgi:hypothetical protein
LADWLTGPTNPYFAKSFVNRVWKELMGRGLIEPTDAIRSTNPPTHPELLARLANEFTDNQYQLRPVIRAILRSAAYQRSSRPVDSNHDDPRFYAHALARPFYPEVYVDAVNDVMRRSSAEQNVDRMIRHPDALLTNQSLAALSGCRSGESCIPAQSLATDLATRLELMNGQFLNGKLVDQDSYLAVLINRAAATDEMIRSFYLRAFTRAPSAEEAAFWNEQLGKQGPEQTAKLADFVWSMLNSQEFLTNH